MLQYVHAWALFRIEHLCRLHILTCCLLSVPGSVAIHWHNSLCSYIQILCTPQTLCLSISIKTATNTWWIGLPYFFLLGTLIMYVSYTGMSWEYNNILMFRCLVLTILSWCQKDIKEIPLIIQYWLTFGNFIRIIGAR